VQDAVELLRPLASAVGAIELQFTIFAPDLDTDGSGPRTIVALLEQSLGSEVHRSPRFPGWHDKEY
jgi:hypothetical protein